MEIAPTLELAGVDCPVELVAGMSMADTGTAIACAAASATENPVDGDHASDGERIDGGEQSGREENPFPLKSQRQCIASCPVVGREVAMEQEAKASSEAEPSGWRQAAKGRKTSSS